MQLTKEKKELTAYFHTNPLQLNTTLKSAIQDGTATTTGSHATAATTGAVEKIVTIWDSYVSSMCFLFGTKLDLQNFRIIA